ncbi:3-oxoacid CoA-transferase [Chloroflexota bacterium]
MFPTFEEAIADIHDGASIMVFHWGLGRSTQNLIRALYEKGTKDLTIISHNFIPARLGEHVFGLTEVYTPLILANQVKRVITSRLGGIERLKDGNGLTLAERVAAGGVELEVMSHGTMAQRIRAGGGGLGGFYTPVGVGTIVEKGKEKRVIDGKEYILEKPLRADFGFVRAYKADRRGNLVYRGSVRGCNPLIAMACDVTIAEVEEIVEVGELDPEVIVTPEVFVHRIVKIPEGGQGSRSSMESLFHKTLRDIRETGQMKERLSGEKIAMRVAKEFKDGDYVNLGVGIGSLCTLFMPPDKEVFFQAEQGVVGYTRTLSEEELEIADLDYVSIGGFIPLPSPGMSVFDIATSFDMIVGKHLDCTVLGGLEVSERGDLANWTKGSVATAGGIGGAMDLAVGAKRVIVAMTHIDKKGNPKIVRECKFPLTAKECVDLIVTDLAVIEVASQGLLLKEIAPGRTVEEVQALTEPNLIIADDLCEIEL